MSPPGWDRCLTRENGFHKKCKNLDNIAVHLKGSFKGSIVKFKLNFEKALENKRESVWWWQISSKTLVCLGLGNLSIVNNLYFQNIILSKHFD